MTKFANATARPEGSGPVPVLPSHLDLLVAMSGHRTVAAIVTAIGGGSHVRVVRRAAAADDAEAQSRDKALPRRRPLKDDRTEFPLALLAVARSADHVRDAAEIGHFELTTKGRAVLRRYRTEQRAEALVAAHEGGGGADRPGRNDAESPLAWLRRRIDRDGLAMITEAQFKAGERLRVDLFLAQLTPKTTQSWAFIPQSRAERRGPPGGSATMSDRTVGARQRVGRAFDAVGSDLSGILLDVCGHLMELEEIEKREAWPKRSAKLLLQAALTALARHYGLMPKHDMVAAAQRRLRHWGGDGYRPSLARWQEEGA